MNNFVKGLLVGVGIGLLFAPMKGEELRNRIGTRANDLRGYLPENEQLDVYRHQISDRVTHTTNTMKDYAQQAASTVKSNAKNTASSLNSIAHNAAGTLKRSGNEIAQTTEEAAKSSRNNAPSTSID